ncbi:MAG: 16S rRNA (uracil(1498)-N(3))-methyltransferase [Alphaproteobacteria bacterium]|nr:16S rRNA (uracil(1498)-N(3))-methyltransferase [Alphaproteobacteria bacterium]
MQNIPRIFLNQDLKPNKVFSVDKNIVHYLRRVMRCHDCLVFNDGVEYNAKLSDNDNSIVVCERTGHNDPSNNLTLCFAPIKKIDDLLNMATQMGVGVLQPVITQRTVARHINWERMKKIIIEAAEQSNRNSVPQLLEPINFDDLDLGGCVVADERVAHGKDVSDSKIKRTKILVGPEGGFSESEFEKIDKSGAISLSLGKTVLRAETAVVVAISKVLEK